MEQHKGDKSIQKTKDGDNTKLYKQLSKTVSIEQPKKLYTIGKKKKSLFKSNRNKQKNLNTKNKM